ncbi:glycosyltransferase family 4 protein [Calditrichota bacterium LG25]
MKDRIKILSVGPYGERRIGGVQYVTSMILNSFLKEKYEFIVLDTTIPIFYHEWRMFRIFLTLQFAARLVFILFRKRPHIMHIHSSNVASFLEKGFLIVLCRLFSSAKIILHLHGSRFEFLLKNKPWFRKMVKMVFSMTDAIIILSENFKQLLTNLVGTYNYIIIPHGVDKKLYDEVNVEKLNDGKVRLSFIGLIGERKGCYELGEALKKLVDAHRIKNLHLEMVGREEEPGELEAIKNYYEKLGILPYVTFHGLKIGREKIKILKQSDIFVLPSRHDSFGIVNLEAMAAGLPVVSTRQGAIPEYLIDGENGFLFEIGDVETLTEKIRILYNNQELREKMGLKNQKKIATFYSFDQILKKYKALYQQIHFGKNQAE